MSIEMGGVCELTRVRNKPLCQPMHEADQNTLRPPTRLIQQYVLSFG